MSFISLYGIWMYVIRNNLTFQVYTHDVRFGLSQIYAPQIYLRQLLPPGYILSLYRSTIQYYTNDYDNSDYTRGCYGNAYRNNGLIWQAKISFCHRVTNVSLGLIYGINHGRWYHLTKSIYDVIVTSSRLT